MLRIFREPLARRSLTARVRPMRIAGRDYEHEFPIAWKNGIWHASEAVSFDLANAGDVLEKANRWLGRGWNLKESEEKFKLYFLLGAPRDPKLHAAFASARNILHKIPCEHELVGEDRADDFAAHVERDLAQHDED